MTAIYYKDQKITYKELLTRIDAHKIDSPIFPVTNTLDCVISTLSCLIKGIPFFPYSPQLPKKPEITIPKGCDFILHTSGSSKMKYVLFKKKALFLANIKTHPALRLKGEDVYLLNLPLYHVAALSLIMRAFLRGCAIAIEPQDPSMVTHISMVPAMTNILLQEKLFPHLKVLLLGGAHIKKELADTLFYKGYPLYVTYGMTEMSSHIAVEKYHPDNGVCFQHFLSGREIKIRGDGELFIKGCGKSIGYLGAKEREYHKSGDIIEKISGKYFIKKRRDNMFISGGENIHPEEIQKALLSHPSIQKVEITIQDHLKWGKRPFVKITATGLCKKSIQVFLADKLEKFKIPKDHEIDLC
ncbi:MAG: 2-succinylbenzoate--CoA ligase [Chlamydiia bacterium]|nr:2-succinylbenzoate--CoA ligase [Chlamydiia bacterium]MCH9618146.1 2-succinylbenzoate--CoA ligase [Chlamydiia bacterium]MCH9624026.1 2-succinylbenzoate--CoA ligase [Chlamydiia bacterium]